MASVATDSKETADIGKEMEERIRKAFSKPIAVDGFVVNDIAPWARRPSFLEPSLNKKPTIRLKEWAKVTTKPHAQEVPKPVVTDNEKK